MTIICEFLASRIFYPISISFKEPVFGSLHIRYQWGPFVSLHSISDKWKIKPVNNGVRVNFFQAINIFFDLNYLNKSRRIVRPEL